MYVLDVIPLSRTAPPEPLSYRSAKALVPGTLVEVPLRKQTVLGLVVSSEPVRDAKAMLKRASFMLSKSAPKEYGKLPGALLTAARGTATYHATTLGSALAALLVSVLTEEVAANLPRLKKGSSFREETCEKPLLERQRAYEDYLDEPGTVLLVVPTIAEMRAYAERFKLRKPLMLSSALSAKKREAALAAVTATNSSSESRLIIATPGFSFIPIPQLSRIIIERMSAGSYTQPKRPYLDLRYALTELARARELPIIYGDYPLPLEYRAEPDKPLAHMSATPVTIVDARAALQERLEQEGISTWQAVPEIVQKDIAAALARGGAVGVLAVRRGYAPTVVCRDCGTAVTDEYGRALSLSIGDGTRAESRVFRTSDGRTIENVGGKKVLCKNCGSWNLMPLGIGVERVAEELRAAFPDTPLLQLDADTVSAKTLKELAAPAAGGRLIVGSEAMLPWLSSALLKSTTDGAVLKLGVIASADSLLALPFWRARERFVRVGLMLAERSDRLILVTRQPEEVALTAISSPTTSEFWKEESGLRKLLHYPPYGTLIVFHTEGNAAVIAHAQKYLTDACAPHPLITLPERPISKGMLRATSVLHLPKDAWPDSVLSKRLAQLPPFVRIHIDSETLW